MIFRKWKNACILYYINKNFISKANLSDEGVGFQILLQPVEQPLQYYNFYIITYNVICRLYIVAINSTDEHSAQDFNFTI